MQLALLRSTFRQSFTNALRITSFTALAFGAVYSVAWIGNAAIVLLLPRTAHRSIPFVTVAIIAPLLYMQIAKMWFKFVVRAPGRVDYSARAQWVSIFIVVAALWMSAGVQTGLLSEYVKWRTLPSAAESAEILAVAVIVGFHEELISRVLLFDTLLVLTRRAWVAIPLTAVIFMATHEPNWNSLESWLWYGVPSVCATLMYWATRSYVAVALGHALADASIWLLIGFAQFPFRSITGLTSISPYLMTAFVILGLGTQFFVARLTGQLKPQDQAGRSSD